MVAELLIAGLLISISDPVPGESTLSISETGLPRIRAVSITVNGAQSPAAGRQKEHCETFKLTPREVRQYLKRAGAVSQHDYLHVLDWSPCFASGTVTFVDGTTGIWGIQQFRAGSLKLSSGKTLYLYGPKCTARGVPSR